MNITDVFRRAMNPYERNPNYHGTPPFVYDPNHPYYKSGANHNADWNEDEDPLAGTDPNVMFAPLTKDENIPAYKPGSRAPMPESMGNPIDINGQTVYNRPVEDVPAEEDTPPVMPSRSDKTKKRIRELMDEPVWNKSKYKAERRFADTDGDGVAEDQGVEYKKKSLWKRFGQGVKNFINAMGDGQSLAQAVMTGATDGTYDERREKQTRLNELVRQYSVEQKMQQDEQNALYNQARIDNIYQDNAYQIGEQQRKVADRVSREKTARMNQVAAMFKSLPSFDPSDPRFGEIVKALGDVQLPVTPKDAKKNVKMVQDQRSGAWSVILTDPTTGKQETRPVLQDGKQFVSTPTVVMQGEYGMLRQNDQQAFTAEQNALNRAQRQQTIDQRRAEYAEQIKIAKDRLAIAKTDAERRQAKAELDTHQKAWELLQRFADENGLDFGTDQP